MIQTSRKLNDFEKVFTLTNEACQFAVETDKTSFIPLLINNFQKSMLGFNLKMQGDYLIYDNQDIQVHPLPNNIQTCQEAANYIDLNLPINFSKALCNIAANDRIVVVNATHMIYDGGFFVDLFPRLLNQHDDENYLQLQSPRKIPITPREIFPSGFSNKNMKELIQTHFEDIKHIPYVNRSLKVDTKINPESKCISHSYESKADDYQFLSNKMGLTDMYWTFIPLNLMAFDNKMQIPDFGILCCVDFRQFMNKKNINRLVCENFTEINLRIKDVKSNMTVRQVGKLMRDRYNIMKKDGSLFASFIALHDGIPDPGPILLAEMSNIGRFQAKPPIVDCWIQQTMKSKYAGSFASFSMFSKNKHGINTVVTRFQQTPTTFNDSDSKILASSVVNSMKNIPVDVTIQQAYDEIRKFQSKARQKHE